VQQEEIEKEIEEAIANDEIYTATVPVPRSTATMLEIREYEVCIRAEYFGKLNGWMPASLELLALILGVCGQTA